MPPNTNPEPAITEVHEEKTEEKQENLRVLGHMKMPTHCGSVIGKDKDFVETIGLGSLRVISINGIKEDGNA